MRAVEIGEDLIQEMRALKQGLAGHLKPGACALVLLSTFGDSDAFLEAFRRHGFAIAVWAERRYVNEKLAVFRLTLPGERQAA